MRVIAGIDLGGTAINFTFCDEGGRFLVDTLCEYPARVLDGPDVCLQQIVDGLGMAANRHGVHLSDLSAVGLGTPGPASASGVLSAAGSTNFAHRGWDGLDLPQHLGRRLNKPIAYLNDGNAAALWGHVSAFGTDRPATTVTVVVGTGLGGGVVVNGRVLTGRNGFAGELGHVLIPFERIASIKDLTPKCNCGRYGDLESLCSLTAIENSLLPFFLAKYPGHALGATADRRQAAKLVRGLAQTDDSMCLQIFEAQAGALGLFFDQMVNTFDPDAFIVGGGIVEASEAFQRWFITAIRRGMPDQRVEQRDVPIHVMPGRDTAGARGAALEALRQLRETEAGAR